MSAGRVRRRLRLVGAPRTAVLFVLGMTAFVCAVAVAGAGVMVRATWGDGAASTVMHIGLLVVGCVFGLLLLTTPWWTSDN